MEDTEKIELIYATGLSPICARETQRYSEDIEWFLRKHSPWGVS